MTTRSAFKTHPWLLRLAAVAVSFFVVVGICDALGWPFLVAPLQGWLSKRLDRAVAFGTGDGRADGVRIGLLGSVRLRAPMIEIAAPSWSSAPHLLLAHNAILKLSYADLWRAYRGQPLRIAELRADDLDAHIERLSDGRASWQFGSPKPADPAHPTALPTFGDLRIGQGTLSYTDAVVAADVNAQFSFTDRSATTSGAASAAPPGPNPGNASLEAHATGTYRKLPLKIDLSTNGALGLAGPDAASLVKPFLLDATIGRASVHFDGTVSDVLHFAGLQGRFKVKGPSLAAVGDPLGLTLPTTGVFLTQGFLSKTGTLWKGVFDELEIGETKLAGAFTFDRGSKPVPVLSGRITGTRLALADLGPPIGANTSSSKTEKPAKAAPTGKAIPDRHFDLPSLKAMDANVLFDIAYLDLGTSVLEPFKPMRAHLTLHDGVLRLSEIDGRAAEGALSGEVQLDGRSNQALWSTDLRIAGVRLERWLHPARKTGAPPYISGKLDADAKLKGAGHSTAEILGSLDGVLRLRMRSATLSHLAAEVIGIDVAKVLGVFIQGDESLNIDCSVANLKLQSGVARPQPVVFDTAASTIWIDGQVSLKSEALDLRSVVSPKKFSPFSLRTPIHVTGTFSSPSVSLEKGTLAMKAGSAVLLGLLNPIAAVIPFIDPGAQERAKEQRAECESLIERASPPPAVATPASARVGVHHK